MDNSSLANFILQKQTGIPGGIQGALDNYAANPDSYSARNAVFQNLYKANHVSAGRKTPLSVGRN